MAWTESLDEEPEEEDPNRWVDVEEDGCIASEVVVARHRHLLGRARLGGGGCGGGLAEMRRLAFPGGRRGVLQDKVLQRHVEQIIVDFSGLERVQQRASWSRTTERGSGGAVLRRDRLSRCFTWNLDIVSTSPLLLHFAHVFRDSLRRLSEEFLEDFR